MSLQSESGIPYGFYVDGLGIHLIDEAEQKVIKCVAKWQSQGFDLDQICKLLESGECTLESEQKDTSVESEIKEILWLIQTGELDRYRTVKHIKQRSRPMKDRPV